MDPVTRNRIILLFAVLCVALYVSIQHDRKPAPLTYEEQVEAAQARIEARIDARTGSTREQREARYRPPGWLNVIGMPEGVDCIMDAMPTHEPEERQRWRDSLGVIHPVKENDTAGIEWYCNVREAPEGL